MYFLIDILNPNKYCLIIVICISPIIYMSYYGLKITEQALKNSINLSAITFTIKYSQERHISIKLNEIFFKMLYYKKNEDPNGPYSKTLPRTKHLFDSFVHENMIEGQPDNKTLHILMQKKVRTKFEIWPQTCCEWQIHKILHLVISKYGSKVIIFYNGTIGYIVFHELSFLVGHRVAAI
ncbi:hypothetical protein ACJX0J_029109, partial [Zea mays]